MSAQEVANWRIYPYFHEILRVIRKDPQLGRVMVLPYERYGSCTIFLIGSDCRTLEQ